MSRPGGFTGAPGGARPKRESESRDHAPRLREQAPGFNAIDDGIPHTGRNPRRFNLMAGIGGIYPDARASEDFGDFKFAGRRGLTE